MENMNLPPELLPVLVAAILQFLKVLPPVSQWIAGKEKQWMPILSIAVGIGLAYAASMANPVVTGILFGLAASGGYDLLKAKNSTTKTNP